MWLLLHFEDIKAPIHRDVVMQHLKRHVPNYEKGTGVAFATTRNRLDVATQRANALAVKFTAYDAPEPFTGIAALVTLLATLRG
jgi:hypothetical protein